MKQRNYIILTIVGIVAMVLMPVAPCRAFWIYIVSEVSTGDPKGYNYETGTNWEIEEWYLISNIDTDADSGGASVQAKCEARCYSELLLAGGESASASASAYCTSWGRSLYIQPSGDDTLTYTWDLDGYGEVIVSGAILEANESASGSVYSSAVAGLKCSDNEGYGCSYGTVSVNSNGSADVIVGGEATEVYTPYIVENEGYYYAKLQFDVDVGDTDYTTGFDYMALAQVYASVNSYGYISASPSEGEQGMSSASAECYAECSTTVSY